MTLGRLTGVFCAGESIDDVEPRRRVRGVVVSSEDPGVEGRSGWDEDVFPLDAIDGSGVESEVEHEGEIVGVAGLVDARSEVQSDLVGPSGPRVGTGAGVQRKRLGQVVAEEELLPGAEGGEVVGLVRGVVGSEADEALVAHGR